MSSQNTSKKPLVFWKNGGDHSATSSTGKFTKKDTRGGGGGGDRRGGGGGRGGRGRGGGSDGSTRGRRGISGGGVEASAGDEMTDLNFANIGRMDPHIKSIINHSSQVAVFTYTNNRWNEALAVGSLFMYERSGPDKLGLVIMNRTNVQNWIHRVTKNFELVVEPPYWLVKDGGFIFCIWFYDANDILKLAESFKRYNHSVVIHESGGSSQMESGLKPPNLMASVGAQKTGESLGDSILAMLTKPKTEAMDNAQVLTLGTNLLNLIVKSEETKSSDDTSTLIPHPHHPLPVKPEPMAAPRGFNESPKAKIQLRTPGASSFAEVAARPKQKNENIVGMQQLQQGRGAVAEQKPGTLSSNSNSEQPGGGQSGAATGFIMQTVEQLEKNQKLTEPGPGPLSSLGSHGFITHERLAQQSSATSTSTSTPQDNANQKMTNDLRAKLGLAPYIYSVSPENDEDGGEQYYSGVEDVDDDGVKVIKNIKGSPWPPTPPNMEHSSSHDNSPWPLSPAKQGHSNWPPTGHPHRIEPTVDHFRNVRFQTIDDIHGKEISEVEPHELTYILSRTQADQAKNLKLMPKPGGDPNGRLVWTNVAREKEHEAAPSSHPFTFLPGTMTEAAQFGVRDLPLTADQLIKTFKLLLRDKEFVTKFHNAYLQVRAEGDL